MPCGNNSLIFLCTIYLCISAVTLKCVLHSLRFCTYVGSVVSINLPQSGLDCFLLACEVGHHETVHELVTQDDSRPVIHCICKLRHSVTHTCSLVTVQFNLACRGGHIQLVKTLVEEFNTPFTLVQYSGTVRFGKNGECKWVSYRIEPYRSGISRSASPNVPYRSFTPRAIHCACA